MGSGKTPCMLGTLDKQYHDGCKRNDDGPSKILVEEFPAAIWQWPSRCRDFALMSIWGNYKHVVPGPQEIWPTEILCASHLRQLCAGISRGALCWSLRTTQRRWRGMIDVDFHPCGNIYIYIYISQWLSPQTPVMTLISAGAYNKRKSSSTPMPISKAAWVGIQEFREP